MTDGTVTISTNIQDLRGIGLEYLVSPDSPTLVLAKFFNGTLMGPVPAGSDEITQEAS